MEISIPQVSEHGLKRERSGQSVSKSATVGQVVAGFKLEDEVALATAEPQFPAPRQFPIAAKRVLDYALAGVGLVLLLPAFAVVSTVIAVASPGPIFFSQERVGKRGRMFRIFKFRTMVVGAESQRQGLHGRNMYGDSKLFKVSADPRVTRIGRVLRRTSIDELPQLLNVLRGEMSLVGPRPPLPDEVANYEPRHLARLEVLPGITGPWQVAGRNEIVSFERVFLLEAEYLQSWSLMSDLKILLRTIPVVLRMRGAH